MATNKLPSYSPEQKFNHEPLPEAVNFEQSKIETEGSKGINEAFENDNHVALPEITNHFSSNVNTALPNDFKEIEDIMEDGLGDMFMKMNPIEKQKFKLRGEETVKQIMAIISLPKVKIKKVFNLIKAWLKMIPGVNRFFLEQTAKIKTDRIVAKIKDKKII